MAAITLDAAPRPMSGEERKVIFASSLGTVFEWYDFYIYATLAPSSRRSSSLAWTPDRPSSSPCWRLPPVSSCVPSARCCSAAWAT